MVFLPLVEVCSCILNVAGKRSDVVKLYDLTTLCGGSVPERGVTPYTVPVAMLLYRVARKLRVKDSYARHIPHIKAMLQTSLQLLDDVEHAEVRLETECLLASQLNRYMYFQIL
jgi:hypothetical protein